MGLRLGVSSFVNNDTVPLNGHTVRPPTAIAMNSVKMLHAVRLAITAIAELLVIFLSKGPISVRAAAAVVFR